MKILHVTKKYPDALGGDAVVVANLEKQQRKSGDDVVVLTSNCDEIKNASHIYKFGLKDTAANLDTITIKRLLSLLALFFKSFKIMRLERPDIIHTHSIDMAFFVSFAARRYHIPIVHTFHIVTFNDPRQSLLRRKTELLFASGANPKLVTAPNKEDTAALKQRGLPSKLLPNGVDIAFWGSHKSDLHRVGQPFSLLSYGRIEAQKGFNHLLAAVSTIGNGYDVTIIGNGSKHDDLERQANHLKLDNVHLLDSQTPQKIRDFMRHSDLVVIPSLYETTPLTLLEAWAAQKPVIMTPVGIAKSSTSSAAKATYQVPIGDSEKLAEAIKQLAHDSKLREKLIAKGAAEVSKYGWPHLSKQLTSYYIVVLQ